jgi:hypothetical protein
MSTLIHGRGTCRGLDNLEEVDINLGILYYYDYTDFLPLPPPVADPAKKISGGHRDTALRVIRRCA